MSLLIVAADAAQTDIATGGYVLGAGRSVPTVAMVLAFVGVVLAVLTRSRYPWIAGRRRAAAGASVALAAVGLVVGGLHMANSAGGPGTGNGVVGAGVAVALGLIGLVLGGWAWARVRRAPGA